MMLQQSLQQAQQFHSMTIADEDISADDDILFMLFASAYCCVVSSPLFLSQKMIGGAHRFGVVEKLLKACFWNMGKEILSGPIVCHFHHFVIFTLCYILQ